MPQLNVIPMGWTHALWWCQVLHERLAEHRGCDHSARLADKRRAPSVRQQQGAHLQYVDNFAVFGRSPDQVRGTFVGMEKTFTEAGLPVHEVEASSFWVG